MPLSAASYADLLQDAGISFDAFLMVSRQRVDQATYVRLTLRSAPYLPQQQVLDQCLLSMQPVLCLVPHYTLRTVDHGSFHFFAAVSRQAMHEQRVRPGELHHRLIHLKRLELLLAFLGFGFEAHTGPDIRRYQIGTTRCFAGIREELQMRRLVAFLALWLKLIARRRRHVKAEAENARGLQPGVAHVVGVSDPGDGF